MRTEYVLAHRLMWIASDRHAFLKDRVAFLNRHGVNASVFGARSTVRGLEEEAFRRIASFCRTSKEVFVHGHELLRDAFGERVFETLLERYYGRHFGIENGDSALEILEPFDGYLVVPEVMDFVRTSQDNRASLLYPILHYEWAVWHAARINLGWPALYDASPLPQGSTLVEAQFDLKTILRELARLSANAVAGAVAWDRLIPPAGHYAALVFPSDGGVGEAQLEGEDLDQVRLLLREAAVCRPPSALHLKGLGLVIDNSFLCCPRPDESRDDARRVISTLVAPLPH